MSERAALRDASFWSRPSTTRSVRFHIVGKDGTSACGNILLWIERAVDAERVKASMRCQRPGCRERWPMEEGGER